MVKKYRVIFKGLSGDEAGFLEKMSHYGIPSETLTELIKKTPAVIKRDATLKDARHYADTIQEAGGRVTIEENGCFEEAKRFNHSINIASFDDFIMCPRCGFKQSRRGICVKCGFQLKEDLFCKGEKDAAGH